MKKSAIFRLLTVLLSVVMVITITGCNRAQEDPEELSGTEPTQPVQTGEGDEQITEDSGVPLVTEYIILSYPSELEDMVSIEYEDLPDGQSIIFTTEFTGESLELFRFSLSKSGADGHELGVLNDEQAGELIVCVDVRDYSSGSWTPEEYAKLLAMQDRVNDIIIQFHEDPRFTPARNS